jgi:dTDP-4-dehydrorhamnose reductase
MLMILGAKGQVGSALVRLLKPVCHALDREEIDLADPASIAKKLENYKPTAIINAAAYTQVDQAESDRASAYAINTEAPGIVAAWCKGRGIPFIHYSTDYVFEGMGNTPWTEDDATQPVNTYGRSKWAGEAAVIAAGGRYIILRTSWVYDESGKNFLNTMLNLAREKEVLRVVDDQHGAPTYAGHLAEATLKIFQTANAAPAFPSGIYHLCHGGATTWHAFAEAIFAEARQLGDRLKVQRVERITTADFPTPARRPRNSRLSCNKARRVLNIELPQWQDGLKLCMKNKYVRT